MNAVGWNSFEACNNGDYPDFDSLAKFLIEGVRLFAFGEECRLLEIEFYLNAKHHPDPFVHCDEAQKTFARWYLHRTGGTLKNGSFKGLDIALGNEQSFFGVLIRSLDTRQGVVCGPCLCVDYLIEIGGFESIKMLSNAMEGLDVRSSDSPVFFAAHTGSSETIYSCPRVGLSTKHSTRLHVEFCAQNYRYLIQPRAVKKGRPELIRGLGSNGYSHEEIRKITGSPKRTITKYLRP